MGLRAWLLKKNKKYVVCATEGDWSMSEKSLTVAAPYEKVLCVQQKGNG
jgi:hypothetical protein